MKSYIEVVNGKYQYYDKHGVRIKHGMYLKHDDGDIDYVYRGGEDICTQIYPLHQFDLDEWEIVDPK